jgi:hypothetical protein
MEDPLSSRWTQLDLRELVRKNAEQTVVAMIDLQPEDLLTLCNKIGVQARQLKVGTRDVWQKEVAKDGYVVRYHDGKGRDAKCDDPKAVHYTLQDWGAKHGNDPEYQSKTGDILISAFDTIKNKRVIVDGVHRGAVMSSKYSRDSDYSDRIVYEWYGHKVRVIFPYDFMQFYRDDASANTNCPIKS